MSLGLPILSAANAIVMRVVKARRIYGYVCQTLHIKPFRHELLQDGEELLNEDGALLPVEPLPGFQGIRSKKKH